MSRTIGNFARRRPRSIHRRWGLVLSATLVVGIVCLSATSVLAVPPPRVGDIDDDGDVDIFDFMDLQAHYGMTEGATWYMGDIDPYDANSLAASGDGDVDIFDFMEFQDGYTDPGGWSDESSAMGNGIPEPASIVLMSLVGAALLGPRKRKGKR